MGKKLMIIDGGIEHIHIKTIEKNKKEFLIKNNDTIKNLFKNNNILELIDKDVYEIFITGKLAGIIKNTIKKGRTIIQSASLWSKAKSIAINNESVDSIGIIDLSASGYMVICVNNKGELKDDLLEINPKCGAGSGINLGRILEKLNIQKNEVDRILNKYLGEKGKKAREEVHIRSDRCGVFSSSATISDKNQGIPLDMALAVTMKSEVLKPCKKMLPNTSKVILTGRVFQWQYTRDCAKDYLKKIGVKEIIFDKDNSTFIDGIEELIKEIGINKFKNQKINKLKRKEKFIEYPAFKSIKEKYAQSGQYIRIPNLEKTEISNFSNIPVNIGLDVGSTMAKMLICEAEYNNILFQNSYSNHGDTIETIKLIFDDLVKKGIDTLNIQNIGITGSGRYQVQKILKKVYPKIEQNIFALVENYAHAYGSINYAKDHIKRLNKDGITVNNDFYILIDIGGEDTKVSIISVKKEELYDNVMNVKCSAGTGSLMDTLKSLFNINSIEKACHEALNAKKAYEINATCAVFLMENAKKMQSSGYGKDEILASCNYAIVENMARTLWNQLEFPENAVVMLHGQTMLSDPLPLAITHRIQDYSNMYCLVPPNPGHMACLGLIKSIKNKSIKQNSCNLNSLINMKFDKRVIFCRGVACGDKNSCCARTLLTSIDSDEKVSVLLGGCSAVNELKLSKKESRDKDIPNAYKEIWDFINSKHPKSKSKNRLVIPRSFAISDQAFFFSQLFEKLGISVYVDNVIEEDILNAQPLVNIDVCAPVIGAIGQFIRLANQDHGMILVPQIEFLPTNNSSLGRTCTTNQGGVVIAKHYAKLKYPDSDFFIFNVNLNEIEPQKITDEIYLKLKPVFSHYNVDVSEEKFKEALSFAIRRNDELKSLIDKKVIQYLEYAIKNEKNISVVCAREYILNPGIFDSHVGKLLKDKEIVALPSYAFQTSLDKKFGYIYWKNPHDILTKINSIEKKKFYKIINNKQIGSLIQKIEENKTNSQLSATQVTTFRCGPDTVTLPTSTEIMKNKPKLLIQSDAMIKELAHLENRVNTFLNQLNNKLNEELKSSRFSIDMVEEFAFDKLNKETDVVYFPTLQDNRALTSVLRGGGITIIDNFDEENYDIENKIKIGRKYTGDSVCAPLAGVFADIILAIEDFKERKKKNDPLVKGKERILIFDNKGTGPCRQGQYYEQHKLLLYKKYYESNLEGKNKTHDFIKLMVGHEKNGYNIGLDEWILIQVFHGFIIQSLLHSIFIKAGSLCKDYEEYIQFYKEYKELKDKIYFMLENEVKPNKKVLSLIEKADCRSKLLGIITKYFGYGLYNNNGLRKVLREFSDKWIKGRTENKENRIKIHVEGEAYMRLAQLYDIFNSLVDSIGFNSFELHYSPLWSYLELLAEYRKTNIRDDILLLEKKVVREKDEANRKKIIEDIKKDKKTIRILNLLIYSLRNIISKPLYKAARIDMPHKMDHILMKAKRVLPTLKPHGEFPAYVGEAIVNLKGGTNLFLNIAPEGCMVSSMGTMMGAPLLKELKVKNARIQEIMSLNGEINEDQLQLALLKTLKPGRYYARLA